MLTYMLNSTGDGYDVIAETDTTLSRVVIPDTYEGLPVTNVSAMFVEFPNLKELVIGNNVKKTAYGTLECESLERIYFGKSISSVSGPFGECKNLSDIYYSGTEEQWKEVNITTIDASAEVLENATMHYGTLGKSGFLMLGEENLFPYTHWDCVSGKPESIDAKKVTYDNSISGLNADNVKSAIDELNARNLDASSLQDWNELLHLVRSGKAAEYINIGDQFVCMKNDEELVWVVIGIDEDTPSDERHTHSLTLQLDRCYTKLPYSFPEAAFYLFYPLSAGNYYIGLKNYASETSYYSFTLTNDLPADSLLRISKNRVFFYADRFSNYYDSVSAALISADELEGTELANANYRLHNNMGTFKYNESDVRYWLNSSEDNWWVSDTIFSLASPNYSYLPGFTKGIDPDFLAVVNPVIKKTYVPDGTEVTTNDKFFLISLEEAYGGGENYYSYYHDNSAHTTAGKKADAIRIKNLEGSATKWWLRNPNTGDNGLTIVSATGTIMTFEAENEYAYGVVPTCCIC